jgi:Flp pilus assembly pilin Flp
MQFLTLIFTTLLGLQERFRRGQTMTEYALILAAIAIAVIAAYNTLGGDINTKVNAIGAALAS